MTTRLRVLTFDVSNTIMKVTGTPAGHYHRVAAGLGLHVPRAALEEAFRGEFGRRRRAEPHYGLRAGGTAKRWWTGLVTGVFLRAGYPGGDAGYPGDAGLLGEVREAIWREFCDGHCYEVLPGVHETLSALRMRGVTLGVLSNLDERLDSNMAAHDVRKYFDFMVTTATTKTSKPDPAMFREVLRLAGAPATETGHVGDDVENDYRAAKDFGLRSAFLMDPNNKLVNPAEVNVDKDDVLTDLTQLLNSVQ